MTLTITNGNLWNLILTSLLTLLIVVLGFLVNRLDKTVDAVERLNQKAIINKSSIRSIEDNFAKKEWVRENFLER